MHLTFLQASKDLGLPPLLRGIHNPAAKAHAQPYLLILGWGERAGPLSCLPPAMHPPYPQLPFYNGATLGLPQKKAPLSVPFMTLWKAPLNLSYQEVACPGATGERV